jgi:hypothetical protein
MPKLPGDDEAIRFARGLIFRQDSRPCSLSYAIRPTESIINSSIKSMTFQQGLSHTQFLRTLAHCLQNDLDSFGTLLEFSIEIYLDTPLSSELATQLAVLAERERFPSIILTSLRLGRLSDEARLIIPRIFAPAIA